MNGKANELTFQNDMIRHLLANGWLLGKPENYNRELALYSEDVLGFVQETQDVQWQQYCKIYPNNPEQKFLEHVAGEFRCQGILDSYYRREAITEEYSVVQSFGKWKRQ